MRKDARFPKTTALLAILTIVTMLAAAPARAEVVFGDDRELLSIRTQSSLRTWKIEDNATGESHEVRQFTQRFLSTFDLGERVDLVLYGSGGFSEDRAVDVAQVQGLGDVKLKAFVPALDRQLLLAFGVNLPTGRTGLSETDIRAARAVAPNVLGFRMRNYGEGLDLDLGIAAGRDVRPNLTLGGGLSVMLRGEYELDETSDYKPAPEFALTGGADLRGDGWTASADLVYRIFGTDELDGAESFEEGNQLELGARANLDRGGWGVEAAIKDVIKSDNQQILAAAPASDNRVANGNSFWMSLYPRLQPHELVAIKGLFDMVAVDQSQQQETGAWAMGLGLGLDVRLTPYSIVELRVQRLSGSSEDDELDLSGWDGVVSVRWQY